MEKDGRSCLLCDTACGVKCLRNKRQRHGGYRESNGRRYREGKCGGRQCSGGGFRTAYGAGYLPYRYGTGYSENHDYVKALY